MSSLKARIHQLVDLLPDEDLAKVWPNLKVLYYDSYMLSAIDKAQERLQPGDHLTREEALRFLALN